MAESIKCVIINETPFTLMPTLSGNTKLNFALTHGAFANGASSPPTSVTSTKTVEFTMTGQPMGWVCYELVEAKIVVQVVWNDPTAERAHPDRAGPLGRGIYLGENRYAGAASGELEITDVALTTANGSALSLEAAIRATELVATYRVRLKTPAQQPATPLGPPVEPTPEAKTTVVTSQDLPPWAASLSNRRKKLLATLARFIPAAVKGAPNPDAAGGTGHVTRTDARHPPHKLYGQGGVVISSSEWWTGAETQGTSCTSYNPYVMRKFFGVKDPSTMPYAIQWGFTPGGQSAWDQTFWDPTLNGGKGGLQKNPDGSTKVCHNPKLDPQPGWKLFKDHASDLPKPGDTYNVWNDSTTPTLASGMHHVGIVVYVPDAGDDSDCWVMADGGQGRGIAGQTSELVWARVVRRQPKSLDAKPPPGLDALPANTPHIGGGAEGMLEPLNRLLGWVDLDDESLASAPPYSDADEDDFADIVRRIENVRNYFKANIDEFNKTGRIKSKDGGY